MQNKYEIKKQCGFFGRVYGYKVLTYTDYSEHADPILTSTRTFESEAEAQAYIEYMQRQEAQGNNKTTLF